MSLCADEAMIFIASPCGYIINRNFIECREDAVAMLRNQGYQVVTKLFQSVSISMNRNAAFVEAWQRKAEWLVFIDTDMEFTGDDVLKLISHGGNVITGVCKNVDGMYALYDYDNKNGAISSIMELKPTVDICGGAFFAIKNNILELMMNSLNREWKSVDVRDRALDYPFNLVTHGHHAQAGEDVSFCLRLMELGIPIYVERDAIIGHEKIVCIR